MPTLRQRLDGLIEPPGLKAASRADRTWFYATAGDVALAQLARQLHRGIGADGRKMVPRKRRVLPDGASGPVMIPHDDLSRAITLSDYMATDHGLLMFWHAGTGHRSYKAAKRRQAKTGKRPLRFGEILEAHAAGEVPNAPIRDVRLSPASIQSVKATMARKWSARQRVTRKAALRPPSVPLAPPVAPPLRKLPPEARRPVLVEARAFQTRLPPRPPKPPKPAKVIPLPKPPPPLPPVVVPIPPPPPAPVRPPAPVPPPVDRLAPYRTWRPATTEAEAVDWLTTRLGVERVQTVTPPTPVHDGDRAFATAADRLAHLNTIIAEWNDLVIRYPGLPAAPIQRFHAIDADRGYSSVPAKGATRVVLAAKGHEWSDEARRRLAIEEAAKGRKMGTERQGTQTEDNFRHELGHALTTAGLERDFIAAAAEVPEMKSLAWFRQNVSDYAGTDTLEAIAESFGVYTRRDYVPGTLPLNLERFFRRILGA